MSNRNRWMKMTVLGALLFLAGCQKHADITLSSPVTRTAVGEEVVISMATTPDDLQITSDSLVLTGPDSNVTINLDERTISFSADTAGSYEISLEQDGIRSNTIRLTVASDDNGRTTDNAKEESLGTDSVYLPQTGLSKGDTPETADDGSGDASQNNQTASDEAVLENEDSAASVVFSVDEVLNQAQSLIDSKSQIIVEGLLPVSVSMDASGNLVAKIYSEDQSTYLVLTGKIPDFGGCPAQLKGTLTYNGSNYVLTVTEAYQMESAYQSVEQ